MKFKNILIWLGIFIIGSLIVSFLIEPTSIESFKKSIKSLEIDSLKLKSSYSVLEMIENPDSYPGEEIFLKNVFLCEKNGIVAYRPDGSIATMEYEYKRGLNVWFTYDLKGKVKAENFKRVFIIEEAIQKTLVLDVNFQHQSHVICGY